MHFPYVNLSKRASTGSGGEVSGDGDAIVAVGVVGGVCVTYELAGRLLVVDDASATEKSSLHRQRTPSVISMIIVEATTAKP